MVFKDASYYFKEMVPHSSILAWRIPWTEELGRLSPWGHKESFVRFPSPGYLPYPGIEPMASAVQKPWVQSLGKEDTQGLNPWLLYCRRPPANCKMNIAFSLQIISIIPQRPSVATFPPSQSLETTNLSKSIDQPSHINAIMLHEIFVTGFFI